jgi:hypothetical protein
VEETCVANELVGQMIEEAVAAAQSQTGKEGE